MLQTAALKFDIVHCAKIKSFAKVVLQKELAVVFELISPNDVETHRRQHK